MPTIEDLIVDLKGLKDLIQSNVEDIIADPNTGVAKINKIQLLSGLDSNGNSLGEYTDYSKKIRNEAGLQIDFIDLSFTGNTQKSLFVSKRLDNTYELTTGIPENWEKGKNKDRFNAIGLTDENEDKLTYEIIEKIESVLDEKFL